MKDTFAEKRTIVFDGVHYLHIFVWLMTKRYDKLAANMVNINNTFASDEDAIALLKERVQIIHWPQQSSISNTGDNKLPAAQVA